MSCLGLERRFCIAFFLWRCTTCLIWLVCPQKCNNFTILLLLIAEQQNIPQEHFPCYLDACDCKKFITVSLEPCLPFRDWPTAGQVERTECLFTRWFCIQNWSNFTWTTWAHKEALTGVFLVRSWWNYALDSNVQSVLTTQKIPPQHLYFSSLPWILELLACTSEMQCHIKVPRSRL